MNRKKQTDILRKRTAELAAQNDKLNTQLNELRSKLDAQPESKKLIEELEGIKTDWLRALQDLNDKRERYANLIADLQIPSLSIMRGTL